MSYLGTQPSKTTPNYKMVSEFTATAGQTTFTPSAYTVGFVDVYRNGVKLGNADFTATNGSTVVLANGCTAGDFVVIVGSYLAPQQNAIPATAGAVSDSYIAGMSASKLSGQVPAANAPSGSVIQVVSSTYTNAVSTTSTSPVTTNLAVSITPKFANSKIFVTVNLGGTGIDGNSVAIFYIYRGASAVSTFHDNFYHNTTIPFFAPVSMSVLDSPATTSSTTYTVYFASGAGTQVVMNANSRSNSIITAMEIAA